MIVKPWGIVVCSSKSVKRIISRQAHTSSQLVIEALNNGVRFIVEFDRVSVRGWVAHKQGI